VNLNWTAERHDAAGEVLVARTRKTGAQIFRARVTKGGIISYSGTWYLQKMVSGKRHVFSLGKVPNEAIALANQITSYLSVYDNTLEAAIARFNPRSLSRPGKYSTIGEVIETHKAERASLDVSELVATQYYACLLKILRRTSAWRKGEKPESISGRRNLMQTEWPKWSALSLTVLDESLLDDYKKLMLEGENGEDMDEEDELTAKITTDTNLRQARGLFGKEAVRLYKKKHLELPDMTGFMGVRLWGAKKFFQLPSEGVVRTIMEESRNLRKSNLGAYRVFFSSIHCGLRRAESEALMLAWIEDGEEPRISLRERGDFKPKHGTGRTINLEPWVAAELRAIAASPTRYMEEATGDREDSLKSLITWLQKHGITATKPIHELRKLFGCYINLTKGLLAAQKMLGHKDPATTSAFYADNRLASNLIPFWTKAS
jgi:integrase